jgi:hypothetical protein
MGTVRATAINPATTPGKMRRLRFT